MHTNSTSRCLQRGKVAYRPPGHAPTTPISALLEALLHLIRYLPPPLRLWIRSNSGHIFLVVRTSVLEGSDQQLKRSVVVNGVVGYVMSFKGGQYTWPDIGVNLNVFIFVLRFELYR